MPDSSLVRASRDGDQFHYLLAARRCLQLLWPHSGVAALTIEGASAGENLEDSDGADAIIDVAEYIGSERVADANLVRYMQLKHSTLHANEPWTASGLQKTLVGFCEKYKSLTRQLPATDLSGKIEFWFVTNRPISASLREAIEDAAQEYDTRHPAELTRLTDYTGLSATEFSSFCKLLRIEDKQDGYWDQRNLLSQDVAGYLPDADIDAPTQLKELVTRKALSESQSNPSITRHDVLRVLKTDEDHLFPAPCLVAKLPNAIHRRQESALIANIVTANGCPVVVHAEGGVGKSIFATQIASGMPAGSITVLYDCFGNGQYRSITGLRHRHRDGLVQIANELAGKTLCHPLIPTRNADPSDYARAFKHRLVQSVTSLRASQPGALLCIVIDAGDNAQIAAEERGEPRSFVKDLLREEVPNGVRLVVLCRTHRRLSLDPPPNTVFLELEPFNHEETATHLRQFFPSASDRDIDEFHRLSSRNPRVQSLVLSRKRDLDDTLRLLGPNPTTVDVSLGQILSESIAKLRDAIGPVEQTQIDRICTGLAALRPLVPIDVLSRLSGVDESAIRSFAFDLGRPLIVTDHTIQFYDEPAETWFRERFKPDASALRAFTALLRPSASASAYAASALPQLMLEAGQFSELVSLALSTDALPEGTPLERRDVELQRLQFALKASLRERRYDDAAKLALRAAGETAGETRQRALLQNNTDLAAAFLDTTGIQEIVSRRTFGSGWVGSHHAYEAALMSGSADLIGDARSRLRMAMEWLSNWANLPDEEREKERISDEDIAEIAMAHLNIHDASACARNLSNWKPQDVTYRVTRIVARMLIDHGRFDDLGRLTLAAGNNICLVLAITSELGEVCRVPSVDVIRRIAALLAQERVKIPDADHWDASHRVITPVTSFVEAAYKLGVVNKVAAQAMLARYLPTKPPRELASRHGNMRFTYLRAYFLDAALANKTLTLTDLAHSSLREELAKDRHSHSRDAQEFEEDVGALLPWHALWARAFTGQLTQSQVFAAIEETKAISAKAEKIYHREESHTSDEIARIWLEILATTNALSESSIGHFMVWAESLRRPLFTPTLLRAARLCALVPSLHAQALTFARRAFFIMKDLREDAEYKANGFVDAARAILTVSHSEAEAFFNQAVEISSKIGDENLDRWAALLDLATKAEKVGRPVPEVAYRFSRCAELTYDYVARDKHFDWDTTVDAIRALCPTSSFAILSRWRDRHFAREERVLPELVEDVLEHNTAAPLDVLPLIGIGAGWDYVKLLRSALQSCGDIVQRQTVGQVIYRYMSFEAHSANIWSAIARTMTEFGIELPDLDAQIAYAQTKEAISNARRADVDMWNNQRESVPCDWDALFNGIDLTNPNDILLANERYRDREPPFIQEDLFREMLARIPAGKEAEMLNAFANVGEFDLYDLRHLLERIPEGWKTSPSIRSALAATVKTYSRRFCMEITKSRYYQILPFELIAELSGIDERELIETILRAVGETPELAGSGRLFTMVGLLAVLLTEDQALDALSFGLDLLDSILEDKDGDGPWKSELSPPPDIETSIAGYIWAGLASPDSALRWESAHCVLLACQLGRAGLVERLIALAKSGRGQPFVDARLPFYERHARLWLLMALARASKDFAPSVAPHFEFLIGAALDCDHVLMRRYAADAALAVVQDGVVPLDDNTKGRLEGVNCSPLPIIQDDRYDRNLRGLDLAPEGDDKYYFGIDTGPYWYAPLGRCFGLSQQRIEYEALKVIRGDWKYAGKSGWEEDERARRGFYRDGGSHHSHGSYPRIDDLSFYLSYHAMMVVAGRLLSGVPVYQSPESVQDDFHEWIDNHSTTRCDGYWLADRRDPAPLEWPDWKNEKDDEAWRWSVMRHDFDRALRPSQNKLNLWAYWTTVDDRREETIDISSALVSPDRSLALLRALQTTISPHDYRVPPAGDELEIIHGDFRLMGWVATGSRDRELDGMDPWAGKISYPPPKPAQRIEGLMDLKADRERRRWLDAQSRPVLWSTVWGHFDERDEEGSHDSGHCLQASFDFVLELLARTGMNLIIDVEIRRQHQRRRYGGNDEDHGFEYVPPNARLFLITHDGKCVSI